VTDQRCLKAVLRLTSEVTLTFYEEIQRSRSRHAPDPSIRTKLRGTSVQLLFSLTLPDSPLRYCENYTDIQTHPSVIQHTRYPTSAHLT
jgi:hypothetical protein